MNTISAPMQGEIAIEHGALNLCAVAEEINREHHEVEKAVKTGYAHAIRAGELLIRAKAQCEHGKWLGWLEHNFDGSARTAQAYMQITKHRHEIEENAQCVAYLSFQEALRLTATMKPETEKSDEDFLAAIPEPSPESILWGLVDGDFSVLVELQPSPEHVGYYHLLVCRGLDGGGEACVDYDRRACKYNRKLLAKVLAEVHQIKPTFWTSKPATEKQQGLLYSFTINEPTPTDTAVGVGMEGQ